MPDYLLSNLVDNRGNHVGTNEQGNYYARPGGVNPDTGNLIPLDQPQQGITTTPAAPAPAAPAPAPETQHSVASPTTPSGLPPGAKSKNIELYKKWAGTKPVTQNVDTKALVQTQMDTLLSSNSPYLTAARQRAKEFGAKRGLLNSSMTAGAAESAAIQAALPIAKQDASTYFSQTINNQNAKNTFALALKKAGMSGLISTEQLSMKLAEDYSKFQQNLSLDQAKIDLGYAQISNSFAEAQLTSWTNLFGNGSSPSNLADFQNFANSNRLPTSYAAGSTNTYATL